MNHALVSPEQVQSAYLAACNLDVAALKPGNVSQGAPGHGMSADDFLQSAEASSPMLVQPGAGLGESVRLAVEATRARVGCNTNLGILLLCIPLAQACLGGAPATGAGGNSLRGRLRQVLDNAGVPDTEQVFAAIRLAAPGGLGNATRHDVNAAARVPLRVAMAEAADQDRIARQYTTDFDDLFSIAVPALSTARQRARDPGRATTDLYLMLLSRFPDTHVRRRHGAAVAQTVRAEAASVHALWRKEAPEGGDSLLRRLDARFKESGVNPGTTADLTVATLFLDRLLTAAAQNVGHDCRQNTRYQHLKLCGMPLISTLMT